MPPPASYIDITSSPFSVVVPQADFNIANERWFRLIVSQESVAGFFIVIGGTFKPRYDLYESDGSTLLKTLNQSTNIAWWYPLDAGTYYLKVTRFGGGASDFDFTFNCDTRQVGGFTIEEDSVVINDDTGFFPAIVLTMDGTFVGYLRIPAGEVGASLPSGESLWQDRFGRLGDNTSLALFDNTGTYVLSTAELFSDFPIPPSITASNTDFYVLDPSTFDVYKITAAGAVSVVATIPEATSIGINAAGTILYYVNGSDYVNLFDPSDHIIHRWDPVNDVPFTDFYTVSELLTDVGGIAITANLWPGELLVLPDGSVVTWARNEDEAHDILLHIAANGSLLNDYTYAHASKQIDHISRAPGGGSTSINIWWYTPGTTTARMATLLLADGTDSGFNTAMFSQGHNMVGNNSQMIGPSTSCAMVTLLLTEPPPTPSPGVGPGSPGPGPPDGEIGPIAWVEEWDGEEGLT